MTWSTTVPDAVDNLVDALEAGLAGILVLDGPVVTATSAREVVVVGYETEQVPAVELRVDPDGLATDDDHEFFTINCTVGVMSGGKGTTRTIRRRAYEIVSMVGAVLAGDVTLGGAVMLAKIGDVVYTPSQSLGGMLAPVVFGVEVEAFTNQ